MRVTRFEDLRAWQLGRELAREIHVVSRDRAFGLDPSFRDQLRRAAVSVTSNVAEDFERGRPKEFHQFLSVAKASCAEVRSMLYLALDFGYIDEVTFEALHARAGVLGRTIGALRAAVARRL